MLLELVCDLHGREHSSYQEHGAGAVSKNLLPDPQVAGSEREGLALV